MRKTNQKNTVTVRVKCSGSLTLEKEHQWSDRSGAVLLIYFNITVSTHSLLFKLCKSLSFFLVVFQKSSTAIPIRGCLGIRVYSVPSWASDCYVRLSVTHTHTWLHMHAHRAQTHTWAPLCYNETHTEDTNRLWQQTNNTFSHVPHLLFSHITPSLLPHVTLKHASNTNDKKTRCV